MTKAQSWSESIQAFLDKRSVTMLFLGFSAGLPILLIFSSLSLWLREAGVERSSVTYFSWAALGYSFKFVWAPLVDRLPLPLMHGLLGRRRSWLLLSQLMVFSAIVWMSMVDPLNMDLSYMAYAAVLLGFSSATQDIVIDAYRIESAEADMQATLSATYIAGYRIAMIIAGAGSLYLAEYFGSSKESYSYSAWRNTYLLMAALMSLGMLTTLLRPEPKVDSEFKAQDTREYLSFFMMFLLVVCCFVATFVYSADLVSAAKKELAGLFSNSALAGIIVGALRLFAALLVAFFVAIVIKRSRFLSTTMLEEGYIAPVKEFFVRYKTGLAVLLLALVGVYRISDIVLGVISNVFYQDMGFSKNEIASAVKTFGVFMSILGGFVGGVFTRRFGVMRMLLWGAILAAGTNLLFLLLAQLGQNNFALYSVIAADNLCAGLASAAFIAFLSSLTNISFTAVQYAVFSSLMTLLPKVIGGYSGSFVDSFGYTSFFIFTTLIGVPVLWLVHLCSKHFELEAKSKS